MPKIGRLRALTTEESKRISPLELPGGRVVEWVPPEPPPGIRPIRFLVWEAPQGRRFILEPSMNPWSRWLVGSVCLAGKHLLSLNKLRSPEEMGNATVMLWLHAMWLPRMKEFRSHKYKWVRDFRPLAREGGMGMLPSEFFDKPNGTSTMRSVQFRQASGPLFNPRHLPLISNAALWLASRYNSPAALSEDYVWRAVVGSMLAGDLRREEVEEAKDSSATSRLLRHLRKAAPRPDLDKAFDRLRYEGFNQLAVARREAGPIDKRVFRRNILCLLAGSFWHMSMLWSATMQSVKGLISPPLSGVEETVFDRLFLPQEHLAGLPVDLLWPRYDIVWPLTFKFLTVGPEDSWRLNAIPVCLCEFAMMDDYSRKRDLSRKGRPHLFSRVEEDGSTAPEVPPAALDPKLLHDGFQEILQRGQYVCPGCGAPITEPNLILDKEWNVWEQQCPCGEQIPLQDFGGAGAEGPPIQ